MDNNHKVLLYPWYCQKNDPLKGRHIPTTTIGSPMSICWIWMPIIKKEIVIAILNRDALHWKESTQLKVEFLLKLKVIKTQEIVHTKYISLESPKSAKKKKKQPQTQHISLWLRDLRYYKAEVLCYLNNVLK